MEKPLLQTTAFPDVRAFMDRPAAGIDSIQKIT